MFRYLDLGLQPLANSYHKKNEQVPYFPLEVMFCNECYHSQLSIVVQPDLLFKNYLYVSGTTQTFHDHCKTLAEDAVARIAHEKLNVLDIACNDGTQLAYFQKLGCTVQGVDPAENLREITEKKQIPVSVAYWDSKLARTFKEKFHIITGTNVFAHVHDVDEFLDACKLVLEPDGLLILEFPYAVTMIKHNEFDTVYHEHLSYFLVHSFATLATRLQFTIVDVLQTPIHGGSIRFFLKKGEGEHSPKIAKLIEKEKKQGLYDKKTYTDFSLRVKKNKQDMQLLLEKLKQQKSKIIGYGASAKGNTMLNYFKIDLDYIIDDNELKWQYETPGRNIPIKSPKVLKEEKHTLSVVILSWNFYKEIVRKIIAIRGEKMHDIGIIYVPRVLSMKIKKNIAYKHSA